MSSPGSSTGLAEERRPGHGTHGPRTATLCGPTTAQPLEELASPLNTRHVAPCSSDRGTSIVSFQKSICAKSMKASKVASNSFLVSMRITQTHIR